jgi:hypothetical protein
VINARDVSDLATLVALVDRARAAGFTRIAIGVASCAP